MAARSTSTTGTGSRQPRPGASPERMIRPSACRRMRVVRWSSWKSSSSVPASVELRSIRSSSASCLCSSDWLRQARLRKTWLTPRRSLACPAAASTAVLCTAVNASATLAISAIRPAAGGVGAASTSSPWLSRSTTFGSRSVASSCADRCSPVSSRVIRRPNLTIRKTDKKTAISPSPPGQQDLQQQPVADRGAVPAPGPPGPAARPSGNRRAWRTRSDSSRPAVTGIGLPVPMLFTIRFSIAENFL